MGCYGGGMGCYGGGGCYGGYGGYSGAPMGTAPVQPAPAPMPKAPTPPGGTTAPTPPEVRLPGSATIVVSLPEGAKLMVDGVATRSSAAVRTFTTPTLNAGQSFYYILTAEIVREGQKLTTTEQVTVRANETTNVSLPDSRFAQTVALK
jgi:uncharacterized protein (TIGR03000 family)